ncbi:MAG: penicillin-binding protein 2 [bacterium]
MKPRPFLLYRVFGILVMVLVVRLVQLQVVQGARYARLSDHNRIRRIVLPAPRGRILDRNGVVLADTRPSFTASVIPTEMSDSTLAVLARLLEQPQDDLAQLVSPVASMSSPVVVRRNLSREQLYRLEENRFRLTGVRTSIDPVRNYPEGNLGCHVLGHIGEVSAEDLARDTSYRPLDFIGRDGIERLYESALRGRDGHEYLEVDARGQEIAPLAEKRRVEPQSGSDLHLTLDSRLQRECDKLMGNHARGAAVVLDVRTGEVLCLCSRPGYDPGMFTGPIPKYRWDSLVGSDAKPFFNRALGAAYPPGSILKPFVALAALEMNRVTATRRFAPCHGSYRYGNRDFRCSSRHGSLGLVDAIAHSCNVYFYQLGLELGLDSLVSFVGEYPFGKPTGIDLPNEVAGSIPDRAWLDHRYGQNRWGHGVLLNFAIGQGEILTTPLQMALAFAALSRDGRYPQPFVVARIDSAGRTPYRARARYEQVRGNPENLRLVRRGLERVVEHGTARAARAEEIAIAGKTGTAQAAGGADHAWFVCYAPADNPEIAVAVIVEHGGHGGAVAAPIARQLVRRWYQPAANLETGSSSTSANPTEASMLPDVPGDDTSGLPGQEAEPLPDTGKPSDETP